MPSQRIVIIGAGISGLLSARVAASVCRDVVVVDRDPLPTQPAPRPSTPQGDHLHLLLPGGLDTMNRLFPKLPSALDNLGGQIAQPHEWYAYTPAGKTYRVSRLQKTPLVNRPPLRIQSRAVLEFCLRQQLAEVPGISFRRAMVKDALTADGQVTGVVLDSGEQLPAGLTIDASGRVSRTLRWMARLGYTLPEEDVVNCDFAYTSAVFAPPVEHDFSDTGFMISSSKDGPYTKRGGSLAKIAPNEWQVTLAGRLGDYPPKDLQGLRDYVATLLHPRLADLLRDAEPLSTPAQYLFPKSVRRRFDLLDNFPPGLLPIGDAICHINPGYAQGMSLACRQVEQLQATLVSAAKPADTVAPNAAALGRYFHQVYEQTRAPWLFAAQNDFTKTGTTGDFPDEQAAIDQLAVLNKAANRGDQHAADLVDAIFDMQRPLADAL